MYFVAWNLSGTCPNPNFCMVFGPEPVTGSAEPVLILLEKLPKNKEGLRGPQRDCLFSHEKTLFFKMTKQRRFQGTCVHTCVLVSGTYPEPVTGSAEPTYFCGSLKRNARFWLPPCLLLKFYY